MDIVAVEPWWQLVGDDENESEDVGLDCIEFVFAETNAYFAQNRLAQTLMRSVSSQVVHNVMDVVSAATMQGENSMAKHELHMERMPAVTCTDRHAVHCVPCRHAAHVSTVPCPAMREETDKLRPCTRKTKRVLATQAIELVERNEVDAMNAERMAWRETCLASLKKATQKTDFAKWAALARAFTVPATRIAMDVGVINDPLSNVVDALAATPVCMKTNVETFAAIVDLPEHGRQSSLTTIRRVSTSLHAVTLNANLGALQSVAHRVSPPCNALEVPLSLHRRSTRLSDSLSGPASIRKRASIHELTEVELESTSSRFFAATETETQAATFPATIKVASGVILAQGDTVIHGPKWVDGPTTMSRKRFNLQQRLALDTLVQASSVDSLPFRKESMPPCVSGKGWREDEQVAPTLLLSPQLSPIVPRTHFKTSLSTPLLRVRSPVSSVKGSNYRRSDMPNGASNGCASGDPQRLRPKTALKAMPSPSKLATASTLNGAAPAKYLREFPTPQAGVVHVVSNQAAVLLSMQERQGNAWTS